ncbi:hypothetical protein EBZ39_10265 [bacterium]|nr:hypothetical protein [bacterium]
MEKHILENYINQNLSLNQISKKSGKSLTTIRYWTKKHNLKSNSEVFATKEYGETRLCPKCKEHVPINQFYNRRGKPNSSVYCKKCTSHQTKERMKKFKIQCVEYKGGKCEKCGYSRYFGALDFHHVDPKQKDFCISHVKSYLFDEVIKSELDKCVLLCACCHREEHEMK